MATVTGTLTDFAPAALTAFQPVLIFKADSPALTAGGVLASRPIRVTPAADGSFTTDLVASSFTTPEVTYTLRIEWLDSSSGYIGLDILTGLVVPPGGGGIGGMSGIPISRWWVGADAPPDPEANTWWLDTDTGDLKEWI